MAKYIGIDSIFFLPEEENECLQIGETETRSVHNVAERSRV